MDLKQLNEEKLTELLLDVFHRSSIHHSMWFYEIQHQYGRNTAYAMLQNVYKKSYAIQKNRLHKTLDIQTNTKEEILFSLDNNKKLELLESLSINWLANDGIWFQEVEMSKGMAEAKRCNDSCWANFSPYEAFAIKDFLQINEHQGLEGLKQALQFRMYAFINKQSLVEHNVNSFSFFMNECRVQIARKRKGLADYPCKSAGLVEYTTFAQAIDERIRTECIACPPDTHPNDFYCGWKFSIE
jgi:hypothetical protein